MRRRRGKLLPFKKNGRSEKEGKVEMGGGSREKNLR